MKSIPHHVGVACYDIEDTYYNFRKIGYSVEKRFIDENLGVEGMFITLPIYGIRYELLENLPDSDILTPFLNRGISYYHIAYSTFNMDLDIKFLEENNFKVIVEPTKAEAFEKICFLKNKQTKQLIELVTEYV